jgi:subtilisin family serine protease
MRRAAGIVLFWLLLLPGAASASAPNDPGWSQQWNLSTIRADRAWARSKGLGVVIAVVDTGVDLNHPDLAGRLVSGYDFVDGGTPMDANGHGTFMAGIVAAATGNDKGVASVAPSAKVMPVRVLDETGKGDTSVVADGIRWAVAHGADVINLSLAETSDGGGVNLPSNFFSSSDIDSAIRDAAHAGRFVSIAAGNDFENGGVPTTAYDSHVAQALVVGASTSTDGRAAYSNYGAGLDVLAPGGGSSSSPSACGTNAPVISTWWYEGTSQYGKGCGTSMAVAHVSGVAALLMARGYSASGAASQIVSTAKIVSGGYRRVDAYAAVGSVSSPPPAQTQSPHPRPSPRRTVTAAASPAAAPSVKDTKIVAPTPSATLLGLAGTDEGPPEARRGLIVIATALSFMVGLAHPLSRFWLRTR